MTSNKHIQNKFAMLGGWLLVVPFLTSSLLVAVVFWRTRFMHREYTQNVARIQQDMDTVDQQILKFGAGINQNQEKLRETNRRITEELFRQQLEFSAVELLALWIADTQMALNVPLPKILNVYFGKTRVGGGAVLPSLSSQTVPSQPSQPPSIPTRTPQKTEETPGAQKHSDPTSGTSEVAVRTLSPDAIFAEQLERWCAEHDVARNPRLVEWMERFSRNAVLGVEGRRMFLVAHTGLHQHRVVWATEPQYVGQAFSKVMKSFYQSLVSENYMRSFLRFQKDEMAYRPLFQMEYADNIGYSDAKYTLSRQWYYGLIPLYGMNLSLGVSSPLTHDFIQELDASGDELNRIGTGLGKLDSDMRAMDTSMVSLKQRFHDYNHSFLRFLFLTLLITIVVLLVSALTLLRFVRQDLVVPLIHMRKIALMICDGQLEARCRIQLQNEVGDLAQCIDQLAQKAQLLVRAEQDRQRVQKDILDLLDVVSRASSGDLTVRGLVSTNEMQAVVDAFNHMMNSISSLVIRVRNAGIQVEQMSRKLLDYSRQILEKSQRQIQELDIASRKIRALGDRSQEITRMVEQIGTIAMETNTLALNASLEAARAGKHDAGIGHLAEHVRQLADGLNKTKQDIESFIGSIQLATNYAVSSMEEVLHTSQQTTSEAEHSYHIAELTSSEAAHLGDAIARFKVKTIEDKEREQRVFKELSFVAYSLSEVRKILREMDSNEYERLHATLSSFMSQLQNMGVEAKLEEMETAMLDSEVPAILPEIEREQ